MLLHDLVGPVLTMTGISWNEGFDAMKKKTEICQTTSHPFINWVLVVI